MRFMDATGPRRREPMTPRARRNPIMDSENANTRAEEAASLFIAQRETGPWSVQDAANLEQWLAEATLHRVIYCRMSAIWQEAGRLKALHASETPKLSHLA